MKFSLLWDYLLMDILSGSLNLAVVMLGDYMKLLETRVPLGLNK